MSRAAIEIVRPTWPEAEIVADPVRSKDLGAPRVLVRRRVPDLVGPHGEELFYLDGPSHISLFTGAGGMDLGLEMAGFCTLVQHEWCGVACQTLIINRPQAFRHAALIQGDIWQTPTSMLLREAGLRVGKAHIVTGGPPCQGFSTSNSKRSPDDPRNSLIFEYLRVVREAQPRFFIFENVPGFCQLGNGVFLSGFLETAYSAYYELVYGIADATEYGVPQRRNRFLCMGTRRDLWECDGKLASLPAPMHFHQDDLSRIQLLEAAPRLFPGMGLSEEDEELAVLTHPPGIRYFPDRPILAPPLPTGGLDSGRTQRFLDFYRKLRREEPDRIVTAPHGGDDD